MKQIFGRRYFINCFGGYLFFYRFNFTFGICINILVHLYPNSKIKNTKNNGWFFRNYF